MTEQQQPAGVVLDRPAPAETLETVASRVGASESAVELLRASTAAPRPELDWERDWQGRPRILPDPDWRPEWVERWAAGRANDAGEVPYTRVTTFAEALQDSSALTRWKMRRVALGAGRRPDYVTAAAALTAEDRDKDALNDVAEKMLEAAGPNAADIGTALHSFTERLDRGEDPGVVPPEYQGSVDAYARVVAHLRFVEYECRTVCDELEAAGTPDRYGFCDVPDPDGETDLLRVVDTKTGRVDYSAGKFSTQLAIYAHSRLYHPGTGKRTKLEDAHGAKISTRWGLIVHTPAGAGTAELLWINLEHGWVGAQQCKSTREWRSGATAGELLRPVFARAPRPATTDGTCRGRKQDGVACGYKAKTKQEDPLSRQFCGRHQDQAKDLERWLAENPDADPASGLEDRPSMEPVQLSSPAVVAAAAADAADRAAAAAEGTPAALATQAAAAAAENAYQQVASLEAEAAGTTPDRQPGDPRPPVELHATPEQEAAYLAGALISTRTMPNGHLMAPPGAVAVSPDGVRWVKVQRTDTFGWEREDRVLEAGGPEHVRCAGSGLPVLSCQCSVHAPEQADLAAAAYERARAASAITPDPDRPVQALELPAPEPMRPQDAVDGTPPVVGTYALDPDTEVNGNPRPVAGLQAPWDAQRAAVDAENAVAHQIEAAQSETELQSIYVRNVALWNARLTTAAGQRSQLLRERERTAKPSAALEAALTTAPDTGTLSRLFAQYGHTELWTPAAAAAAEGRWNQLAATAQL